MLKNNKIITFYELPENLNKKYYLREKFHKEFLNKRKETLKEKNEEYIIDKEIFSDDFDRDFFLKF